MQNAQRLTIFRDVDDALRLDYTPILGTVDGSGAVTEATCSTRATDVRPYLKFARELSESSIDFRAGASKIGQINVDIVDVPTTIDQATGWFTAALARDGDTQLLGRRALLEQLRDDGTWYTVLDGVIGDVTLKTSTYVTYSMSLRDIRERERVSRAFVRNSTLGVAPRGVRYGWGDIGDGKKLIPDVKSYRGLVVSRAYKNFATGELADPLTAWIQIPFIAWQGADAFFVAASEYNRDTVGGLGLDYAVDTLMPLGLPVTMYDGVTDQAVYSNIIVDYGEAFTDSWQTLRDMPVLPVDQNKHGPGAIFVRSGSPLGTIVDNIFLVLTFPDLASRPDDGTYVSFRIWSAAPPTEDVPFYIERNFGSLLRGIYDGEYSNVPPSDPRPANFRPPIRYNDAAMTAFELATPTAYVKLTEPVDDPRRWVEEHIYKPLGYAPALNEVGEIVPIKYQLPSLITPLLVLNDRNVKADASWVHNTSDAVTRATFKYKRVYLKPPTPGASLTTGSILNRNPETVFDRIDERPIEISRVHGNTVLFGSKEVTYEPSTVYAFTTSDVGVAMGNSTDAELGALLASARLRELIDRFASGAQRVIVKAAREAVENLAVPQVRTAKLGDWVQLQLSWLPEYNTQKRGTNRLMQIVAIKDTDPAWKQFTLSDAGPMLQPVAQPTIANLTLDSLLYPSVDVTSLPMYAGVLAEAELFIAYNATEPSDDSTLWQPFTDVRRTTIGTVRGATPVPAGATIWVRAQGVAVGRRRSLYTSSLTLTAPSLPALTAVVHQYALGLGATQLTIGWTPNAYTGGVRIRYGVSTTGLVPDPLPSVLDVDAADGSVVLPVAVRYAQAVTFRLEAWSDFTGGAVSGTQGVTTPTIVASRGSSTPQRAVPREQTSETASVGTLALALDDIQGRVTLVEFATQIGDGAMSAYFSDTSPYAATVALVEKHPSKIAYRVTGYNEAGDIAVLAENVVTFRVGEKPVAPTVVPSVDATSGTVTATVTGDVNTASIKTVASKTGVPTATDVAAGAAIAGRVVQPTGLVTLNRGERAYVAAIAYSATGVASVLGYAPVDRPTDLTGGGTTNPPFAYISTVAETSTSETVRYAGSLGAGGTGPLQWRRRIDTNGVVGTPSAWANFPAADEVITRAARFRKRIVLETQDSGNGLVSVENSVVVEGSLPAIDIGTGKFKPDIPLVGGSYIVSTSDASNRSDFSDSSRFINKHLGNVPDDAGSNRYTATANEKLGGARAVTAIDSGNVIVAGSVDFARGYTNKNLDNIAETGARKHLTTLAKTQLFDRTPAHGQNILPNAGFEDVGFWLVNGSTSAYSATSPHTGNACIRLSVPAGTPNAASQSADVDGAIRYYEVFEGQVIKYGGWGAKETGDGLCRYTIGLFDKDKLNPNYYPGTNIPGTNVWTFASNEITVPAGKKYMTFYCEINAATVATAVRYDDAFVQFQRNADDVKDGTTKRVTTLTEATGGGRGYNAIDSGGVVVAGAIDIARPYSNKHLGNIPDDAGSNRYTATATEKTGGARGAAAIGSDGMINTPAIDIARPYANKNLTFIQRDGTNTTPAANIVGQIDDSGRLSSAIGQLDNAGVTKRIARNYQRGTARHGDVITFPTPYGTEAPRVVITGGVPREPVAANWSAAGYSDSVRVVQDLSAQSLSSTGFTVRALLRQKQSTTSFWTHNFATSNALSSNGATSATPVILSHAPTTDGNVDARGLVALSVSAPAETGVTLDVTVACDIDILGTGAWTEVATKSYSVTAVSKTAFPVTKSATYPNESFAFVNASVNASTKLRFRIKNVFLDPAATAASYSFTHYDGVSDPSPAVSYYSPGVTADITASMTPDADHRVTWVAWEDES